MTGIPSAAHPRHIIELRGGPWAIDHPSTCTGAGTCSVAKLAYAERASLTNVAPGRYEVEVNGLADRLLILDRIDPVDSSPLDPDRAHDVAAFRAARLWAEQNGHAQPDDRMLTAYGRALLASLGRCGAAGPVSPAQLRLACELPSGHGGWHRDGITEWTTLPAETRVQYGVRITFDDGHVEDQLLHPLQAAQKRVDYHRRRRAESPGWRAANAEVIEQTVTTSAWAPHALFALEGDSR
ncbi:hypothetical protein [Micromonospora sp. RV43]|uniref:hypothetical protein n=1 Tax=Micromonospora sp. RV43 TaxID=1661387 RepID=UPI00064BC06C|nr:hypothetical protein [Micromonospora sp. RV43]